MNNVKRIVSFSDITTLLYDIDITDELMVDKKGYPIVDSLLNIVEEYMKGIIENDV